jgi:hypothetical protein
VTRSVGGGSGPARGTEQPLAAVGVVHPELTIRVVEGLDRLATGKLQRFVPLGSR